MRIEDVWLLAEEPQVDAEDAEDAETVTATSTVNVNSLSRTTRILNGETAWMNGNCEKLCENLTDRVAVAY